MMENLLSSSSSMIETPSVSTSGDRVDSPGTVAEFDGETVLCRVCGDRASGFHYGVHACEGCKGFFRRSIQQKIQYRPCLRNQQCNIQRVNRNRCQFCRLKKCISVGMSRDAVRFGRVPKKEKAKIIEQMQKKNLASQSTELNTLLASDQDMVSAIVTSHRHTCDMSQFRAQQMREQALLSQEFVTCSANMACPLNNEIGMDTNRNNLTDFSESYTPTIKSVVDFAKGIPGFVLLNQDDQVTLLKAGTFEVLLVRLACLFDPTSNTMMFTGGKLYQRQSSTVTSHVGFLLDSMFDFAERFNRMGLNDDEIAVFSAVVLMSPDRPGLRNVEQVEKIQNKLTDALQNIINTNHREDATLFAKLLMKTTDLRTLNTLHSEKSVAGQRSGSDPHDDQDQDYQDSLSSRSGRSSPTLSEASTMTSGYSEVDNNNMAMAQQFDPSNHQQIVLKTPYGMFIREEVSGFYAMMSDQPRRRCNTLDRDTLTRPRLHTIEEGNKRRYTLDRDYISKMVSRLGDRLEIRNALRGDSMPTSISSSAASSPIQEENFYSSSSSGFTPITAPDGAILHGSMTRTSPGNEALLTAMRTGSSPGSPKSRSRSGSLSQDESAHLRPRCYSFHINSEGRASRAPMHSRLVAGDEILPDVSQYLSPEMRRGSVGATHGLHSRKQSLPLGFVNRGQEVDKHHKVMKHMMSEGPVYGMQLVPDMASHPGPWQMPPVAHRPHTRSTREWELMKPLPKVEVPPEKNVRDVNRNAFKLSLNSQEAPTNVIDGPGQPSVSHPQNVCPSLGVLYSAHKSMNGVDGSVIPKSQTGSKAPSESGSPVNEELVPESFGHKKFDKFRKDKCHMEVKTLVETKPGIKEEKMEVEEDSQTMEALDLKVESPCADQRCSPSQERPKLSAKEAHPNLLAHLMNGGKPRVVTADKLAKSAGYPWSDLTTSLPTHQLTGQHYRLPSLSQHHGVWSPGHSAQLTTSESSPAISSQSCSSMDLRPANSKEEVHAAAVSYLKDKLLRKIDSVENLNKVGQESPTADIPQTQANPFSLSSCSSTADLNKDLATKLTLTPSASAGSFQNIKCPFSSSQSAHSPVMSPISQQVYHSNMSQSYHNVRTFYNHAPVAPPPNSQVFLQGQGADFRSSPLKSRLDDPHSSQPSSHGHQATA